ncbi:MAG: S41 family peptidase [Verrucomicrobiales bacterium]
MKDRRLRFLTCGVVGLALVWVGEISAQVPRLPGQPATPTNRHDTPANTQVGPAAFDPAMVDVQMEFFMEAVNLMARHGMNPKTIQDILSFSADQAELWLEELELEIPISTPGTGAGERLRDAMTALIRHHYPGNPDDVLDRLLNEVCKWLDRYSAYNSPNDWSMMQTRGQSNRVGVGMAIEVDPEGYLICYPYPRTPAEEAGLQTGDRLLEVDGVDIQGLSLVQVSALIRGEPGTSVVLRVMKGFGRATTYTIERPAEDLPPVFIEEDHTGPIIRIRRIDEETVQAIKANLSRNPLPSSATLDLRASPGGDLESTLELASLFLPTGTLLTRYVERESERAYVTQTAPLFPDMRLLILQDYGTASAAEVFIAGLVENAPDRVVSQGETTNGKGVVQMPLELSNGGRLVLSSGLLFTPHGNEWFGHGLLPSIENDGRLFPAD